MDRGAWQATVHGITKSWTQLKQFSMHEIECEKEYLSMYYVCTTELLCYAAETNTALFIIYSSIKCISDNN